MGGPASPELAIFYCSYRELLHIRSTSLNLRGIRWIDDILLVRNIHEPSALHQIDYELDFGSVGMGIATVLHF